MAIKALVIDLDSTLYEHEKEHLADLANLGRTKAYLKKKGVLAKMKKSEIEDLEMKMSTGAVITSSRAISRKYGLKLAPFERYIYDLHPEDFDIKRDPKLISKLSKLSKSYKLAILSNAHVIWANRALKVIGVDKLISKRDIVTLTSMKGHMKPEPEVFEMLLKRLKMKKSEILFIDDREKNIEGARRLGIQSIKVHNSNMKAKDSIYAVLDSIR